jgi:hypothetical protein
MYPQERSVSTRAYDCYIIDNISIIFIYISIIRNIYIII